MEGSSTVCSRCMGNKDLVLIEHDILPELSCSYCEKAESQLLCQGQPSCYACYRKATSPKKTHIVQSMMGQPNQPMSSVLSYRMPRQSETKLSKKVESLLKDCRSTPLGLAAMRKKALLYYGLKDTPRVSWQTFIQKCEKKHPLVIFTSYQDRLIGGFFSESLDPNKSRIADQECGIFQQNRATLTFWGVQSNRIRMEGKSVLFGEPESLRFQLESMRFQTELIDSHEPLDLDNLYVFRL